MEYFIIFTWLSILAKTVTITPPVMYVTLGKLGIVVTNISRFIYLVKPNKFKNPKKHTDNAIRDWN